jgi:SAM-dependent methyltransferase
MDAQAWDRRYEAAELVWTAGPNQFVAGELAGLPAGRALDLAAGEGRNALWLAERGWRVTAVDFSKVGLAKAARIAEQRGIEVDWVLADVLDFTPRRGGFELVLLSYLQLPGEQLARVLRGAAAALAPGGTLLAVGHDRTNLTEGVGGPQQAEVLWTAKAVRTALPGLHVARAERVRREVPGAGEAIDTLVLARSVG